MSSSWQNWSRHLCSLVIAGRHQPRNNKWNRGRRDGRVIESLQLEALEPRLLLAWNLLSHNAPANVDTMLVRADGAIMAQQSGGQAWYQLTPDTTGSYVNGSWSNLASMANTRLYYASDVLPSGNIVVVGGEYSSAGGDTNRGEMYNIGSNSWSAIAPYPETQAGDAVSEVLPNGRVLVGYLSGPQTHIYDPASNTWSNGGTKLFNDSSSEESWVKLPDGSILSYDIGGNSARAAQRYLPSSNTWVAAGVCPVELGDNGGANIVNEMGGAFLLPDGRAFFLGASGRTALYTPSTNSWVAGPLIPGNNVTADAPGAVLPNGDVLFAAAPHLSHDAMGNPIFPAPTRIYEYNPSTNGYTDVTPAGYNLNVSDYVTRMVVLPSGQVALANGSNQIDVYTAAGGPNTAWRPQLNSISRSGSTVTLTGTQLNGISEGAGYGDDAQMASNFPLVQLHNIPFLGNPYLRTSNWSSTGVATGSTPETVQFALGTGIDVLMSVVANGISSPTALAIEMSPSVNNILLRVDPNNSANLQILNNGSPFDSVPFSSFSSIMVTCDSSTDTVSIENTRAGVPVSVSLGNGTDTINVSPTAHNLDNIQGNISLSGGSGLHRLNISDSGKGFMIPFTPPGVYTVTPTTVQRNGTALITYAGMTSVALSTGINLTVPGTIGITGTAAGTATGVTVQPSPAPNIITVGGGNHTLDAVQGPLTINGAGINLLTVDDSGFTGTDSYAITDGTVTAARLPNSVLAYAGITVLNFNTGSGGDTVTLTNAGNTLDGIGNVTVNDASGTATVVVDDSGFGGNESYAIIDPTVSVARLPNFLLTYSGIAALNLNTGPGSDTFDIDSTSVSTAVTAGAGGNIFHISPFTQYLASIVGPLALNGGGSDILEFFDANDPNAETFSFDSVPSTLTLGSTGVTMASFAGMGGGVYVVTNGFSTPDDQSGTVIFDPAGGPPSGSDSIPGSHGTPFGDRAQARVAVDLAHVVRMAYRETPSVPHTRVADFFRHVARTSPDPWAFLDLLSA